MAKSRWWERAGLSEFDSWIVHNFLRSRERIWRGAHTIRSRKVDERLNRRRFAADLRRKLLRGFQVPLRRNVSKAMLVKALRGKAKSTLLDALFPGRADGWLTFVSRTERTPIVVRNFSFIDFPVQTMDSLGEIAKAEARHVDVRMNFADEVCSDIGSFLVLQEMWRNMMPVFAGGDICEESTHVLERLGLRRALRWRKLYDDAEAEGRIIVLPFRRQERPEGAELSSGVEAPLAAKVTTEVVEFIDNALAKASGVQFKDDARRSLKKMIGEVLANAVEHGTKDSRGSFAIAGFMARRDQPSGQIWRFHLGFLSLGETIASSLAVPPPEIADGLQSYVRRHRRSAATAEDLTTVYALRDGVTRLSSKLQVVNGRSLGGTGLGDILDLFADLSRFADPADTPALAIISGSTYIRVADPYRTVKRVKADEGDEFPRREIWFNPGNDPAQPPDPRHVFSLPGHLPGTLVTLAFNMNQTLFSEAGDGEDRS